MHPMKELFLSLSVFLGGDFMKPVQSKLKGSFVYSFAIVVPTIAISLFSAETSFADGAVCAKLFQSYRSAQLAAHDSSASGDVLESAAPPQSAASKKLVPLVAAFRKDALNSVSHGNNVMKLATANKCAPVSASASAPQAAIAKAPGKPGHLEPVSQYEPAGSSGSSGGSGSGGGSDGGHSCGDYDNSCTSQDPPPSWCWQMAGGCCDTGGCDDNDHYGDPIKHKGPPPPPFSQE